MRKLNLQLFAEGEPAGGDSTTFEINGQQMTAEQVAESYKKLQGEFTKVTQKNSELSKQMETVKPWLDFDQSLTELEQKTGQAIKPLVGSTIDGLLTSLAQGKAPTTAQIGQLDKAIDKAEGVGNDKLVEELEYLKGFAYETHIEKTFAEVEAKAKSDELDFDRDEFTKHLDAYLEDLGIGEDDEFDTKLIHKAYESYEAKKLKEAKGKNIPPLGTSGGASSPARTQQPSKVGGLRGAAQAAAKLLGG